MWPDEVAGGGTTEDSWRASRRRPTWDRGNSTSWTSRLPRRRSSGPPQHVNRRHACCAAQYQLYHLAAVSVLANAGAAGSLVAPVDAAEAERETGLRIRELPRGPPNGIRSKSCGIRRGTSRARARRTRAASTSPLRIVRKQLRIAAEPFRVATLVAARWMTVNRHFSSLEERSLKPDLERFLGRVFTARPAIRRRRGAVAVVCGSVCGERRDAGHRRRRRTPPTWAPEPHDVFGLDGLRPDDSLACQADTPRFTYVTLDD